jgi:hypothetical protein
MNFNTIWDLEGPNGNRVTSFSNLALASKQHFHSLFMEKDENNIGEIIRVVRLFPRFFNDEMNTIMEAEVTGQELKSALGFFNKAKSPGPNGWTVEFYLGFYDFLEKDILHVIEESRRSGKILSAMNVAFIALITKKNAPLLLRTLGQ